MIGLKVERNRVRYARITLSDIYGAEKMSGHYQNQLGHALRLLDDELKERKLYEGKSKSDAIDSMLDDRKVLENENRELRSAKSMLELQVKELNEMEKNRSQMNMFVHLFTLAGLCIATGWLIFGPRPKVYNETLETDRPAAITRQHIENSGQPTAPQGTHAASSHTDPPGSSH